MPTIMEAEASVTTQNQITIPVSIRKVLDLGSGGGRIIFRVRKNGEIVVSRALNEEKESEDPALAPFLELLAKDMSTHPKRLRPFPAKLLKRARAVTKGVKVDLEGPLTGQD